MDSQYVAFLEKEFASDLTFGRKKPLEHFQPGKLGILVGRHTLMAAISTASQEKLPHIPDARAEPKEFAKFVATLLWWPITREMAIISCQRWYESMIIESSSPTAAARYTYRKSFSRETS